MTVDEAVTMLAQLSAALFVLGASPRRLWFVLRFVRGTAVVVLFFLGLDWAAKVSHAGLLDLTPAWVLGLAVPGVAYRLGHLLRWSLARARARRRARPVAYA